MKFGFAATVLGVFLAGCSTDYSWRSSVPEDMRSVSVPTFRNESMLTEFGSIATRQVLREFQREGSFAIRPIEEAAVEIQGVVKSVSLSALAMNRRSGLGHSVQEAKAEVLISVIDKTRGSVVVNNRQYKAQVMLTSGHDLDTTQRDAAGRLADDLARQVVDDVLQLKWE